MDRGEEAVRQWADKEVHMRRARTILSHLISFVDDTERQRSGLPLLHSYTISQTASSSGTPEQGRRGLPVVVGAMVMDVQAVPQQGMDTSRGTTVPGKVRFIPGGVGRNIAECMARLDVPPFMISVVGKDSAGDSLLAQWKTLGLPIQGIRQSQSASTPVVAAVFEGGGEMAAAVADVSALEDSLTPDWVAQFQPEIQNAPIVLVDGNLLPTVLELVCGVAARAGVPVWFEPVSVPKSVRATRALHQVIFVSPNERELVAMAEALGGSIKPEQVASFQEAGIHKDEIQPAGADLATRMQRLDPHVRRLLGAGVKCVVLTLGSQGAVMCHLSTPGGTNGAVPAGNYALASSGGNVSSSNPRVWAAPENYCAKQDSCRCQGNCNASRCQHEGTLRSDTCEVSRFDVSVPGHPTIQSECSRQPPCSLDGCACCQTSSEGPQNKSRFDVSPSGQPRNQSEPRQCCRGCACCQTTQGQVSSGRVTYWHYPALAAEVVNLSGAGDCLVAGTLAGIVTGRHLSSGLALGMVAANRNVECAHNVPPTLLRGSLDEDVQKVVASVTLVRVSA